MSFFEDIAIPLIARNLPVIPLRPRSKIALLNNWPELATTSIETIREWGERYPDANCAVVAEGKIGGNWILELDNPELTSRIESETGQALPKTFRVRSSPGRGHLFFKQTPASLAMNNITQNYVKGNDFSVRVNREYVVGSGSWHPTSGRQYEVVSEHEIVEAPIAASSATFQVVQVHGSPEAAFQNYGAFAIHAAAPITPEHSFTNSCLLFG